MRKAKIICTLGPASSSVHLVGKLIGAGMDVARLNFSHGSYADQAEAIGSVRAASEKQGQPIAIL